MTNDYRRLDFPQYAMALAVAASARSEDPYDRVGAVVLRADRTVAGTGYNGAPAGMTIDWSEKKAVRMAAIHAESNALRLTTPSQIIYGFLATTKSPCVDCLKLAAAYGLADIYYGEPAGPSHAKAFDAAEMLNINLHHIDLDEVCR